MGELEWLVKMVPQGAAVSAVVGVMTLILLRYIPTLLKENRETVQGIVDTHAKTQTAERELYRTEMKELRTTFHDSLKGVTDALSGRIDNLTEAHRDLRDEVHGLRSKLE